MISTICQRRQQPPAIVPNGEARIVVGIAQRIPCDIDSSHSAKGHLYAREEQEGAEEIKRPVERFNERDTNADHHTA